jgi:hypothetical protein
MTISPDDKMAMPISDLVFSSAQSSKYYILLIEMLSIIHLEGDLNFDSEIDPDYNAVLIKVVDQEDKLLDAYKVALRCRVKELCHFAESVGIPCTESFVWEDPFDLVLALHKHLDGD